jgi:hypothetical protein
MRQTADVARKRAARLSIVIRPIRDNRLALVRVMPSPLLFHYGAIIVAMAAGPPVFSATPWRGTVERRQFASTVAKNLAWLMPASKIIANGCNMTLASLDLVEPERTDRADPEDILAAMACKERRILDIAVMRHNVVDGHLAHLRRAVGQRL